RTAKDPPPPPPRCAGDRSRHRRPTARLPVPAAAPATAAAGDSGVGTFGASAMATFRNVRAAYRSARGRRMNLAPIRILAMPDQPALSPALCAIHAPITAEKYGIDCALRMKIHNVPSM